jgi:DNA topoisomerase-1
MSGKILVIVESPGKIKKLQAILGDKYIVMASKGHIIDLHPKKMSIKIENKFEPEYYIMGSFETDKSKKRFLDKTDIVNELKKVAKKASDVLLAADEDREGEMIAWSVAKELGLDVKKAKRIAFNSITKTELEKAIKNPRTIDMDLVDAQKSRRILDRLIGFEISPILWKSIGASLSAGRVQSVVVRLLIDKENEIKEFLQKENTSYFKFNGLFEVSKNKKLNSTLYEKKAKKAAKTTSKTTKAKSKKTETEQEEKSDIKFEKAKIDNESTARTLMKSLMKSEFTIKDIIEKDSLRQPSPPFTTSTLVQEAARKIGFTVKRTNSAAQKLYEAGYITYMRTDSVNLSSEALENIKKFILEKYGKEYHRGLNYEAKSKNTQEAHEACRPTDVFVENVKEGGKEIGSDESKLYNLIWKRSVASQMQPAKIKLTDIIIDPSKVAEYSFMSQISNIDFPGFLLVYNVKNLEKESNNDGEDNGDDNKEIDDDTIVDIKLPKIGTKLDVDNITGEQEYQKPQTRYNEASLVNKLDPKNLNIGRPSTYGSIINTIQERNYVIMSNIEGIEKDSILMEWNGGDKMKESVNKVVIGKENNKLIPTSLGMLVTDFLIKNFNQIVDYKFTALMEELLDKIAEGKKVWHTVLQEFYDTFHPIVKKLLESKSTVKSDMTRVIGNHPTLGHEIVATIARFGAVIKMCTTKTKCIYAPIKEPLTKDTITLEQALKLLEYPKELGKHDGMQISLNKGKHGLYLKWGDVKASIEGLPEEIIIKDKENITFDEAVQVIKNKRKNVLWEKNDAKVMYTILKGPYGNYIDINDTSKKIKKKSLKVPLKDIEDDKIKDLTLDKVKELIKIGMETKSNRFKKKTDKTDKAGDVDKPKEQSRVKKPKSDKKIKISKKKVKK